MLQQKTSSRLNLSPPITDLILITATTTTTTAATTTLYDEKIYATKIQMKENIYIFP